MNYELLHDVIIDRARDRTYNNLIHHKHHIIPIHEDSNSIETVPLTFKEHYVIHHLRWKMTNTLGNQLAYKIMKGIGNRDVQQYIQIEGGKLGGRVTKDNNLGIFSDNYDRGAQTRLNWSNGIMDNLDFYNMGKLGGTSTRKNKSGIFREDLQHLRSEWATIGALALNESGNRGGCCSKSWMEKNKDQQSINCSKGGKIGGKKVGSMLWWNDGIKNTKSVECPSPNHVRGCLESEKKRKSRIENLSKKELK